MQEPFPVIGLDLGARWRELGGGAGPFGNPLAAEEDVPGHRGRRQRFVRGEIALSVDSDLVTSVYRLRNEATFQRLSTAAGTRFLPLRDQLQRCHIGPLHCAAPLA